MNLDRPIAPEPYGMLPEVPSFELRCGAFGDGQPIPDRYAGPGEDVSPALEWSGFPAGTKSFMINCFDPDAPTPAGYWHWTAVDVPVAVTSFEEGAGESDATLPAGFHVAGDGGTRAYAGPYPPEGDRPHRYYFAVHALDVESLGLGADATPTTVAFNALFHTLARAVLHGTYQR